MTWDTSYEDHCKCCNWLLVCVQQAKVENLQRLYEIDDNPDRKAWLDKLLGFMEERGTPITQCPTISKNPLDLYKLYMYTKDRGGFLEVSRIRDAKGSFGTFVEKYLKIIMWIKFWNHYLGPSSMNQYSIYIRFLGFWGSNFTIPNNPIFISVTNHINSAINNQLLQLYLSGHYSKQYNVVLHEVCCYIQKKLLQFAAIFTCTICTKVYSSFKNTFLYEFYPPHLQSSFLKVSVIWFHFILVH